MNHFVFVWLNCSVKLSDISNSDLIKILSKIFFQKLLSSFQKLLSNYLSKNSRYAVLSAHNCFHSQAGCSLIFLLIKFIGKSDFLRVFLWIALTTPNWKRSVINWMTCLFFSGVNVLLFFLLIAGYPQLGFHPAEIEIFLNSVGLWDVFERLRKLRFFLDYFLRGDWWIVEYIVK